MYGFGSKLLLLKAVEDCTGVMEQGTQLIVFACKWKLQLTCRQFGISKDLFVQFVGDRYLVDKARDKSDLVWSTLHNSIKNNIGFS